MYLNCERTFDKRLLWMSRHSVPSLPSKSLHLREIRQRSFDVAYILYSLLLNSFHSGFHELKVNMQQYSIRARIIKLRECDLTCYTWQRNIGRKSPRLQSQILSENAGSNTRRRLTTVTFGITRLNNSRHVTNKFINLINLYELTKHWNIRYVTLPQITLNCILNWNISFM